MAVDSGLVRSRKALFCGDVGIAVEAVAGSGASSGPEVLVGETDSEVGGVVGSEEADGVVALVVEEVDPLSEIGVVSLPVGDGVVACDAGGEEDGLPKIVEGKFGRFVGEDERCPGGSGGGDDRPVDGEAGDELHGGLVGLGHGRVGSRDFVGILGGEQGGVGTGNAHACGVGFVGGGEGVVVPGGSVVEAAVGCVLVAGERGGVIGVKGGDELGSGFIGLLGDAADERNGFERSGDDELLIRLEAGSDSDRDFGEAVELMVEGEEREGSMGCDGCRTHDVRVGGGRTYRKCPARMASVDRGG